MIERRSLTARLAAALRAFNREERRHLLEGDLNDELRAACISIDEDEDRERRAREKEVAGAKDDLSDVGIRW